MFPWFLRPERVPFASIEIIPTPCPWCPGFVSTPGHSHVMCQGCRDLMLFTAMKRAERLEAEREGQDDGGSTCGAGCGYCGACS